MIGSGAIVREQRSRGKDRGSRSGTGIVPFWLGLIFFPRRLFAELQLAMAADSTVWRIV